MSLVPSSSSIETGGSYTLSRSLRFRSSASANLTRVYGTPTNRGIYTFSLWTKIAKLATGRMFFMVPGGTYTGFVLTDTDQLKFFNSTGAGNGTEFTTSAVYRDPSAWYHIVLIIDYTQSVGSQVKFYVNGVQQTVNITGTGTAITQTNTRLNTSGNTVYWGTNGGGGEYYDGYFADAYFIDGQALTPSSFGQTDATTGVWVPKKYTGTYGTNGFYLPFTNTTSATTLAYDSSGNGNNWTPNNISTTAGVTYDSMTDVPTLTSATAANFAVLNPLNPSTYKTESNGNLTSTGNTSTDNGLSICSMGVSSGKWVWEATIGTVVSSDPTVGITATIPANGNGKSVLELTTSALYRSSGSIYKNTSLVATSSALVANDVVRFELNMDALTCAVYVNNVLKYTFTSLTAGTYFPCAPVYNGSVVNFNFGQRPFVNTPNSGFLALNTFNLSAPTIPAGNKYMDATTFTGNASTNVITNAGSMQPDLVWMKARNNAQSNTLIDSVRGGSNIVYSNNTDVQSTGVQAITSFNSNGFTLGSGDSLVNSNGYTYVGWQWKESAAAGFDIVTYTGTGSNTTIAHNLGIAPSMMFVKTLNSVANWTVYHKSLGATYGMALNLQDAAAVNANLWNNTEPTSSNFSVGVSGRTNAAGINYVAYLFSEISGYSKFGSYTGNGSADGVFIYTGFKPKFVLIRASGSVNDWFILDTARNTYNVADYLLRPNSLNGEQTFTTCDFLSNGIKIRNSDSSFNANGATYIYAAFAENPFKYANAR